MNSAARFSESRSNGKLGGSFNKEKKMEIPTTFEDALGIAKTLAQDACDHVFKVTGERPHYEQRENSLFIIWPDGEETNEIEILWIH